MAVVVEAMALEMAEAKREEGMVKVVPVLAVTVAEELAARVAAAEVAVKAGVGVAEVE